MLSFSKGGFISLPVLLFTYHFPKTCSYDCHWSISDILLLIIISVIAGLPDPLRVRRVRILRCVDTTPHLSAHLGHISCHAPRSIYCFMSFCNFNPLPTPFKITFQRLYSLLLTYAKSLLFYRQFRSAAMIKSTSPHRGRIFLKSICPSIGQSHIALTPSKRSRGLHR